MADTIKTECSKLTKTTDEEIERLRQDYEAKVRKLFESYRQKENSVRFLLI